MLEVCEKIKYDGGSGDSLLLVNDARRMSLAL